MNRRARNCTLSGEEYFTETTVWGLRFYKRISVQKWSPTMHEHRIDRGIRIGAMDFGFSRGEMHLFDGKVPRVVPVETFA